MLLGRNMKTKRKLIITVSILVLVLVAMLATCISGAYFFARRQSVGRIKMPKGIVIEYDGFVQDVADSDKIWDSNDVTFKLFEDANAYPGKEIALTQAKIKPAENSIDFYARYKFQFKFYQDIEGEDEIGGLDAAQILIPSKQLTNPVWRENELFDGYYYYAPSSSLGVLTPESEASSLFAAGANFVINPNFTGMGPGIEVTNKDDEVFTIMRIDIYLVLEVAQVGINWQMNRDPVIFDMDSAGSNLHLQDENGDEIDGDITCDGSTVYQIVDKDGNGLQYTFKPATNRPDVDAISEIYTYVGDTFETITIPDYIIINGEVYMTTTIGDGAFDSCSVETLIIPDTVETIGDGAFNDCDAISTIYIGKGVKTIGDGAFSNTGIYNLFMGPNVETIGENAFSGNYFRSVEIPASVTSIGLNAFGGCVNLDEFICHSPYYSTLDNGNLLMDGTTIYGFAPAGITDYVIPDGVETIGDSVFNSYANLATIKIPSSVTTIETSAFSSSGLTRITIPDSVTDIGTNIFHSCKYLKDVKIGSGITKITNYMFGYCNALANIVIPSNINEIEANAFHDCRGLTSIAIPNTVLTIGSSAFHTCLSLEVVELGDGITTLAPYLFSNCSKLKTVKFGTNIASLQNNVFYNCIGLESIEIPEGVTQIGASAFENCSALKNISLPSTLSDIGNYAFRKCTVLDEVIVKAATPPSVGTYIFYTCTALGNGVIYVPAASVASYKAAGTWKNYDIQPIA